MGLQHLRGSVKQPGRGDEQHHVAVEYVVGAEQFSSSALLVGPSSPFPQIKGLLSRFWVEGDRGAPPQQSPLQWELTLTSLDRC